MTYIIRSIEPSDVEAVINLGDEVVPSYVFFGPKNFMNAEDLKSEFDSLTFNKNLNLVAVGESNNIVGYISADIHNSPLLLVNDMPNRATINYPIVKESREVVSLLMQGILEHLKSSGIDGCDIVVGQPFTQSKAIIDEFNLQVEVPYGSNFTLTLGISSNESFDLVDSTITFDQLLPFEEKFIELVIATLTKKYELEDDSFQRSRITNIYHGDVLLSELALADDGSINFWYVVTGTNQSATIETVFSKDSSPNILIAFNHYILERLSQQGCHQVEVSAHELDELDEYFTQYQHQEIVELGMYSINL